MDLGDVRALHLVSSACRLEMITKTPEHNTCYWDTLTLGGCDFPAPKVAFLMTLGGIQ
jgi:hypothetical protein